MFFYYNIIIAIVYLIVLVSLAYKVHTRTSTASDNTIAAREMRPSVMALSYGAGFLGTTAVIGFGGAAALFGCSLLWLSFFTILVGIFIAFVFFGRRTRRMGMALNAHTFPEILGERYQSRFIQGFAGMVVFVFIPIYAAAILIGVARFIEVFLHIPYVVALGTFSFFLVLYVILGGFKAVLYTDAFQGVVMFVLMVIFCYLTYHILGGIIPAHQALTDIAPLVPEHLVREGHLGWTAGLRIGSPLWWTAWSSLIYGVGIGILAQPQLVERFLRSPSDRDLNRSVLVGGIFLLAMIGVPLTVGPLTNSIFMERFGYIAIVMAEGNMDKIIPLYIDTVMPWWFGIVFLMGILTASLAALSSQLHVGGASFGRDFYGKAMGLHGAMEGFTTKLGITMTIIATILWGLVLPPSVIVRATAFFFGLCAASFLPLYFFGLYWKGVTKAGGIASMVGGIVVSFIWMIFFHDQESTIIGLCRVLFGASNLVADFPPHSWIWQLQYVDPVIVALPLSCVLCLLVSSLTRKMPRGHLNLCFKYISK
ncbi:MAG: sodium:solute symporter family protein [Deltaproteobacteria bacterium]|nr:sodium:solute symporter family protein [Deltaproteobacteria bacterium]